MSSSDQKVLQRIVLAFTTGLFLACAAHVSAVSAETVADDVTISSTP